MHLGVFEVVNLAEMVTYQPGQVVSRTVAQNKLGGLTLFAFPEGEGLSTHTTPADALVYILDGEAHIDVTHCGICGSDMHA